MYTIGRLARRARVNADSIRFYERQGLITPAGRTDTGYRLYTDDAVRLIAFIKHAQHCGFSLAEIGRLLQMHKSNAPDRGDAYRLAARKQKEIGDTIASLQAMAAALTCVLAARSANRTDESAELTESPLLTALERGTLPERQPGARGPNPGREENRIAA